MKRNFTAACVQAAHTADLKVNTDKLVRNIREAKKLGADLVVLSELHNSLYFCQKEDTTCFDLAESIPGPSTELFSKLAKELGIVLITSLFEKRAPGLFHNTAVVFDNDGALAGKYRKMHIPDDPGFYEKFYFTPGDLGFSPIKTSLGKIGVLICWDQWYPEAARISALSGSDFLVYPTAIGWDPHDQDDEKARQLEAWVTIQRGHAVANGIPVLSVNRTGFESPGIQFWGNSFIAGCQGEFIRRASADREEILIADIDLERSEAVRRIWPFLRDRRIDAFEPLTKRYID